MSYWVRVRRLMVSACIVGAAACATQARVEPSGFVSSSDLQVFRLLNRGVYEFARNRFEESEAYLVQARSLAPTNTQVLHSLALVHSRMGDFARAHNALQRLFETTESEERRISYAFELGNVLSSAGEYQRAQEQFEDALARRRALDNPSEEEPLASEGGTVEESPLVSVQPYRKKDQLVIGLLPILDALLEISWLRGQWDEGACYAREALDVLVAVPNKDYDALERRLRRLVNFGRSSEALALYDMHIPKVLQESKARLAALEGLAAVATGQYERFLAAGMRAVTVYDSEHAVLEEYCTLARIVLDAEAVETSVDRQVIVGSYVHRWPPELLEMTVAPEVIPPEFTTAFREQVKELGDRACEEHSLV